jgi:TRAP-type C4-dicarboxylate transport system substrate-binding protein
VIVNKKALDALDKPSRDALLKAAAAAESRGWKVSEEKTNWYLEQLQKNGMSVVKPSPDLTAGFKKVGDQMLADWLKKSGADGKRVIDAYRKM